MVERAPIPIHDVTAPIACTITSDEIPERVAIIERMRAALADMTRTPDGLLLHFPDEPAVRADLATFTVDEKRCCQFWSFDLIEEASGVALRWDGPPAVDSLLDQLHRYFSSDAPISSLEGLL